jgi:hypothetical protein
VAARPPQRAAGLLEPWLREGDERRAASQTPQSYVLTVPSVRDVKMRCPLGANVADVTGPGAVATAQKTRRSRLEQIVQTRRLIAGTPIK